jgi:dipeptidase E
MEYLQEEVKNFYQDADEIVFIPYARPSGITHDQYTEYPRKAFAKVGIAVKGIHEFINPAEALRKAKGIFTGGGNTFVLLKTLYENGLMDVLKEVVAKGTPYMGSSAGSNITGLTVGTSNDMPIVYPPSFDALQFLPFNINPHYLDPDPDSKHQGETRETRINEFHHYNQQPVVGLREGSWLRLEDEKLELKGNLDARLFEAGKDPVEVKPGDWSSLL